MSLFVSTVSSDVVVSELGITLVHPTTNFQVDAQFSSEHIQGATSLTSAILAGTLTWKRSSGGVVQTPASYDPYTIELEQEALNKAGTVQIDFGSITTKVRQQTLVVNNNYIKSDSIIKVALRIQATTDHTIDELVMDPIEVLSGNVIENTSFTIYAEYKNGSGYGKYLIDYQIL